MEEIWKDIIGYEGLYQVSNTGRVRSLHYRTRKLRTNTPIYYFKLSKTVYGYVAITLCKDNKRKVKFVHRLVAETFIPNPDNKPQVNHIDGCKSNNCITNLEWATQSENMKHSYKTGLHIPHMLGRKGKLNPLCKPINQYTINGNFVRKWDSIADIGRYFNATHSGVCNCLAGRCKTYRGYIWEYADTNSNHV